MKVVLTYIFPNAIGAAAELEKELFNKKDVQIIPLGQEDTGIEDTRLKYCYPIIILYN